MVTAVLSVTALIGPNAADARMPGIGPDLEPVGDLGWREVLDRAVVASLTTSYVASMVVVSLDEDGPAVTEVELHRDRDGDLAVTSSEAWLIARDDTSGMFREEAAGRLLRVGEVESLPFALPEVERLYDLSVVGRGRLATGAAVAVAFERAGVLRERLFVDDETGLVVRRETYDMLGNPVRVTALTEVRISDEHGSAMAPGGEAAMTPGGEAAMGPRTRLSPGEVRALDGHAWDVPTTVGDGFDLRAGFAVEGGAAVQLVYSDGLYTISVLEQPGRPDPDAMDGAVRTVREGVPVYRWPGAEPERMVWAGQDRTFTAVTDAPTDVLLSAVADLPHDRVPSLPTRLGRGLARLAGWLWPFG